jgi:hypothetical protein
MATIANMVDFVVGNCHQAKSPGEGNGMKQTLLVVYAMIFCAGSWVYDFCWRPSWSRGLRAMSFVYFIGSSFQLLGLLALCMKIRATKSVAGISSQSLGLTAMSLACRVLCTTIYDGYLPVDESGDMWVQIVDGCSLAVVIYMLYSIHKTYKHTYSEDTDDLSVMPIVFACVASALFIRADLNRDPLFDFIWALGLNMEVFQMLPQLYMLTKFGGVVENTTAHFVVNVFVASVCRFAFWMWATPNSAELAPTGSYTDMNLAGFYILGAHALEIIVMLDFICYYVSAVWHGKKSVHLPEVEQI